MSRLSNEISIVPSLLDRLLDFEPELSQEPPKSRLKNLREIKQSIKRDLEWLLNTRSHLSRICDDGEEVRKSVLAYGLPDFTGVGIKSHLEQNKLTKAIEEAILIFEPRLTNLKISLEPFSEVDKTIRFRIEAFLKIEPVPEPVVFDTVFRLVSGEFEVKDA
ncbi:MAG: type VI secretion system baseplate subunit TssE [Pyrinomonadaceae bacterium]|nr:type VI secretion system baseplate subunit TssE [Pyrinomonadaceae bacterium]MCX7639071.1 type VI secretion system baseplate subunit TssE [Pyrinomonadaceae bacterium]MDW8303708.1 type VI secretion system baseplate subunit TssE [Acidobacteriota bacterium]